MDKFGHQGYVAYFGLLEIISKENGKLLTGNLTISPLYLRRKLRISSTKLQLIFNYCSTIAKLSCNFQKEKWIFKVPKLLELKDNYTKDLQVACNKPSHHKEAEEEVDKDKEIYKEIYKEKKPSLILKEKKIWVLPEEINKKSWKDFEEHRKNIKKPLSGIARIKACNILKDFSFEEQMQIINKSIVGSWAGLFPDKKITAITQSNPITAQGVHDAITGGEENERDWKKDTLDI